MNSWLVVNGHTWVYQENGNGAWEVNRGKCTRIRLFRIGTRGRASQTTQIKISAWPSITPHQRMEVGSTGIAVTNTESFVKYHFYKLIIPKRAGEQI